MSTASMARDRSGRLVGSAGGCNGVVSPSRARRTDFSGVTGRPLRERAPQVSA
jgi:hypothetical protein